MAPVSGVHAAPRDAMPRWPIGGYFASATMERASSTLDIRGPDAHDPYRRIAGSDGVKDL